MRLENLFATTGVDFARSVNVPEFLPNWEDTFIFHLNEIPPPQKNSVEITFLRHDKNLNLV